MIKDGDAHWYCSYCDADWEWNDFDDADRYCTECGGLMAFEEGLDPEESEINEDEIEDHPVWPTDPEVYKQHAQGKFERSE